ncbi:hypothetical protein AB205_0219020 [Aquarana catesbeiana]|uniref:Uncharacterized protein n=1 Tax=Aquarana catesbeiana TaxID=8400 RepID=A0A2G9RGB4_AQUCT|nr:hypothetical protein AB205_0219020 [Aquarana catesbeiana]
MRSRKLAVKPQGSTACFPYLGWRCRDPRAEGRVRLERPTLRSPRTGFSMPWTLSALIFSWILMKLT